MLLHLVRHGHYPLLDHALGGREAHSLSDEGHRQAQRAADALASCAVAAVVASPVQRAAETAAPIASRHDRPLLTDAAFTEIDFAAWTGRPFGDLAADPAWHAWNRFRCTAGVPGGETILQVQGRAIAGVINLGRAYPDQEVVVVTHADVVKVVLMHFLGMPLDLLRRLEIAPGSISQLRLYPEDAKVVAVNMLP